MYLPLLSRKLDKLIFLRLPLLTSEAQLACAQLTVVQGRPVGKNVWSAAPYCFTPRKWNRRCTSMQNSYVSWWTVALEAPDGFVTREHGAVSHDVLGESFLRFSCHNLENLNELQDDGTSYAPVWMKLSMWMLLYEWPESGPNLWNWSCLTSKDELTWWRWTSNGN